MGYFSQVDLEVVWEYFQGMRAALRDEVAWASTRRLLTDDYGLSYEEALARVESLETMWATRSVSNVALEREKLVRWLDEQRARIGQSDQGLTAP